MSEAPNRPYTIYILHFDRPYWKTAQHYVGYTSRPLEKRMVEHRSGKGAKICRYAMEHGIGFQVVHTEEFPTRSEARKRELQLKRERNLRRHCGLCQMAAAWTRQSRGLR